MRCMNSYMLNKNVFSLFLNIVSGIISYAALIIVLTMPFQNCRNRLEQTSVTDEAVSECLCSLLLLEDLTTEQLFAEFLSVRLVSLY